MKYDFTSILDRRGMDAIAVDAPFSDFGGFSPKPPKEGFDFIPMWVADMNFPTVPTVQEAMMERVKHPAFGYFSPTEEYFDAMISWQERRNGVKDLKPEHIGYENGVLGGVVSALSCFASPGDAVLLHRPTYIGFSSTLSNNGYQMIYSDLKKDETGIYRMDFEDMECKIKEHHIHATIFCSPHNPTGRAWERWEIEKAMEIFERNHVMVISDEIWSDLLLNGHSHTPTQSVNAYAREHTVALYAPSKTFNLAGLVGSYHIIYNETLRDLVTAKSSKSHYNMMNVLSMHGLIGAYKEEGYEWVDELCQVLSNNVNYAVEFISQNFSGVKVTKPEATYMLFLDCTDWCRDHKKSIDEVLQAGWEIGVGWQDGRPFHGTCHIRMNLAVPFSRVKEAFDRLERYVFL